jgi:hypothetical protein
MPFYVLPKDRDKPHEPAPDPREGGYCAEGTCGSCDRYREAWLNNQPASSDPAYPTRDAARENCPPKHHVVFVATSSERRSWQARERARLQAGEYFPVPWSDYDEYPAHYAHLSQRTPGLVAYTKNDEHGLQDRQTAIKPGRYLEEFYKTVFTRDQIAQYVAACQATNFELHIARTPDEIERVYRGGPTSCMGRKSLSNFQTSQHPVRVYGDSDLGIAYYGSIDAASARCIVWPDRKLYGRLYGGTATLARLLENAGYHPGSMHGARVRAVLDDYSEDDRYIMPYVDGIERAQLRGKYFILGSGDWSVQNTEGFTSQATLYTCDECGNEYDQNDGGDDTYCQSCLDDMYVCADCEETCFSDGHGLMNGDKLCDSCYGEAHSTCAAPDCENEWIERNIIRSRRADRNNRGVTDLCTACDDSYAFCSDCDEWYENTHNECPACHPETETEETCATT